MFWRKRASQTRKRGRPRPALSVVVVVYNIPREAARSLFSLSIEYQRHIDADEFEVIVVDNGSSPPLDRELVGRLAGNFRLLRIDDASPSPAQAVNRGLAEAQGDVIGVMIDGARIATPGLLHFARHGADLYRNPVVATLGWYLGYDYQRWSMLAGYDRAREDALLDSIGWPQDGYRLFEIATLDESSVDGWVAPIAESNALFLRRQTWDLLDGMDPRFDSPGGGLVNLDTFRRALELTDVRLVVLLGEGTFHQLHGGVASNTPHPEFLAPERHWHEQYERIRRQPWDFPGTDSPRTYIGVLPRPALARFAHAIVHPSRRHREPPLGAGFDRTLWSREPPARPADPATAGLVDIAHNEFRAGRYNTAVAVARLTRQHAPEEPEPQRLLALIAGWRQFDEPPEHPAEHHLALAEAHRLLGDNEKAESNYRAALSLDYDLSQAHIGLSTLRMPGELYLAWLERLYTVLSPRTVIEIGVGKGASLSRVRPPTIAIGVDPEPNVACLLKAETHIFPETSDAFFARRGPDSLLAGDFLGIGFVDGLHLYEQSLRDFINLEKYCGTHSVILLHDTVPLDEPTQSRTRTTDFWTGDVWKTVLCLKHYRPDLDVFTIATPWTGLTVATGFDPTRRMADKYEEAVRRFIDMPFSDIGNRLAEALNIVPNDWGIVEARLKRRGIL